MNEPNVSLLCTEESLPTSVEWRKSRKETRGRVGRENDYDNNNNNNNKRKRKSHEITTKAGKKPSLRPNISSAHEVLSIWLVSDWKDAQQTVQSLEMYQEVAFKLIEALTQRREQCYEAKQSCSDAAEKFSRKETPQGMRTELILANAEIDSLSDGLIDLYVAQTMDWLITARSIAGSAFDSKTKMQQLLSIGLASLSIVLKMHHCDIGIALGPTLPTMAQMTDCDKNTLFRLEMALLRSVNFNIFKFTDCYTLLTRSSSTMISVDSQAQFDEIVGQPDFLERFGAYMRAMIVDRIETFAKYTPWVRANAALAMVMQQAPTREAIGARSPSRKEAKAMLSIIEDIEREAR